MASTHKMMILTRFHSSRWQVNPTDTTWTSPYSRVARLLGCNRRNLPVDTVDAEFVLNKIPQLSIQHSKIVILDVLLQKLLKGCSHPNPEPPLETCTVENPSRASNHDVVVR